MAASSVQASLDRVVEVAQCEREFAAQVLFASRGDVGLAITRIIEGSAGGAVAPRRADQNHEADGEGVLRDLLETGQILGTCVPASLPPCLPVSVFSMCVCVCVRACVRAGGGCVCVRV